MQETKNDNNNIIQPSQVPRKIGKDENLPQKSNQNNVNAFDYNDPPKNHSLDSKDDEQVEKNKKPKSRWKYYLLFFVGLLTIGGGIALAVVASPWCGFLCLAGLIMCAVGIIGWNGAEQSDNLPYNQEVEKKSRDENGKEKGKSNEISKEQNQNVSKEEAGKLDIASILNNVKNDVKNEVAKSGKNLPVEHNEEPSEIIEPYTKSTVNDDKSQTISSPQPIQEQTMQQSINKEIKSPIKDKHSGKHKTINNKPAINKDKKKKDIKSISDFAEQPKITDKNNNESKKNLNTNNQSKTKDVSLHAK